tara:strand:- start:11233 stop:11541 length:309 start_codon:yes stop_codon:yes gene_type:complete
MEFNNDLWIEIKCFLFRKDLWDIYENRLYSKVISQIPRVNSFPRVINYKYHNQSLILTSKNKQFLRQFESIIWNYHTILVISYIKVPNNKCVDEYAFDITSV